MKVFQVALYLTFLCLSTVNTMAIDGHVLTQRATNSTRYVFAHFIIGTVSNRNSSSDWDADMIRAKSVGLDAFALNLGTNNFTDTQLGYAYASAANNGMKVFLSFDFNWWSTGSASTVGQKIAQYASLSAQLMVDGKVFVSTFTGDGVDVNTIRSSAGTPIYFAPNFLTSYSNAQAEFALVDAGFNWMGWPNNGNNRAPNPGQNGTVEAGDQAYISMLNGKDYMAPVSPWFFTHYGPEVSYSKNWLFPTEMFWYTRWQELLTLGPRFIEIVSWNDYGESHYVGPLSSPHVDDGASKWCNDMPHNAWLDMSVPWIQAYKAFDTSVNKYITSDQLFYWYRPQLKNTNCDATDSCEKPASGSDYYIGPPDGWQTVSDSVFVVSLLKSAGTLNISSGGNSSTYSAPAGANSYTVPMAVGQQIFSLTRNNQVVIAATSEKDVISGCVCGLYNFNAYVGSVPGGMNDALQGSGYNAFSSGLVVTTCSPTPSLTPTPISTTVSNPPTITTTTSSTASTTSKSSITPTSTATSSTTTPSTTTPSSTTSSSTTSSSTTTTTPSTTTPSTTTPSTTTPSTTTPSTTTPSSTTSSSTTSSSTTSSKTSSSNTSSSSTTTTKSTTKPSTTTTSPSTTTTTTSKPSTSTSTSTKSPTATSSSSSSSSTITSTKTTTTTTTTTTSSSSSTTTSATCNGGSGPGNYAGLCSFGCSYGYCPGGLGTTGPCTCSSTGTPGTPPASNGRNGIPAAGLDSSYAGLCSYACNHGYCPSGACQYSS